MLTGHVLVGFLSMVCVLFLSVALGDGRSVIIAETNNGTVLFHDGYGVGVFKDSRGNHWGDKGHPIELLGCDTHQKLGNTVKSFSIIALVASCGAVLVSLLGASGAPLGMVNAILQVLMFLSFLIAMSCGWAVVKKEYSCDAGDVKLDDLFILNYGLFFLLAGAVVSLLNIVLLVVTGSMSSKEEPTTANEPVAEAENMKDIEQ